MAYKNGNYSAFYVNEPFDPSNLGPAGTKDFNSYNLLRAWEAKDPTFPFIDSHNKNYNVRDGSDWERTLKPRLRSRLSNSKNIILFLSSITKNSKALREEINYGANTLGLPIVVIYPDYEQKNDIINCSSQSFRLQITRLWDNLPVIRESMNNVPTLHIPFKQSIIRMALNDKDLMVNSKINDNSPRFYPC